MSLFICQKPKLLATLRLGNSLSSQEESSCRSHNIRSFCTQLIKFLTLNTSATATTSVTASSQCRFLLVDSQEKSVRLSFPKFRCFKLAENLFLTKSQRHVGDLLDLFRHVKIDLSRLLRLTCNRFLSPICPRLVYDLLKTCRRPGRRRVLSRFKAGLRQNRCNGI